jgi:hypothetical protein
MNHRQQIALADPCHRAMDTVRRKFNRVDGRWSTTLTVNK